MKTAKHFTGIYPKLKVKQPLISSWLKDEVAIQAKEKVAGNSCTKQA
jgi:hypothetical protein